MLWLQCKTTTPRVNKSQKPIANGSNLSLCVDRSGDSTRCGWKHDRGKALESLGSGEDGEEGG